MTTGRDRKGHVQGICKREDKGVACKPRKFRKFNVGRGIGGGWAVAEWHSQEHECVSVCQNQYQMLFLTDAKSRVPSSLQLWLAHNIILCSPVAGGDRGGGCKDNTHSALLSLLGPRYIIRCSIISVTQFKCDLNQQFDLFNIFYFKGPNNPNYKQTFSNFPPFALLPPDFERSVFKIFAAIQWRWMKYCKKKKCAAYCG